jgi:hypothetical protein
MKPEDDGWPDTGMLFGAAVIAGVIYLAWLVGSLPGRLWRAIK